MDIAQEIQSFHRKLELLQVQQAPMWVSKIHYTREQACEICNVSMSKLVRKLDSGEWKGGTKKYNFKFTYQQLQEIIKLEAK